MKLIKLFSVLVGLVVLISLSSCTKQLARININPNAVENPQPAYLLTNAIITACNTYWSLGAADGSNGNPSNLFVQYWASDQYTDQDRYIFANNDFQGFWTSLYSGSLINLNEIIQLPDGESNSNYKGIALILRSWEYCLLTDAFGDIPYSQSIQIEKYPTPAYDPQQKVYEGILNDLKIALDSLNPDGAGVNGDVIYNGNINLWEKLDNSLRLRIALRIADREPDLAKSVIQEISNSGGNYISSNSEIAELNYLDAPNDNPLAELFLTRDDYRISKTIVDTLLKLNDPRLPIYAAPTQNPTPQIYVGFPNGLLPGNAGAIGLSNTSRPGSYFLAAHSPAVIMSYAEVLFDRAEAAARGFTDENAKALYQEAITASLQQYNISQNVIDTYLDQPDIQYNPNNFKESIGDQKWIALFGEGSEAFAEWRRLGYPLLKPAVAGVLNGQMPLRFIYPGTEQSLNNKGYQQAITDQGPNLLTTRLWFDVN
ncbi:MAG: SusD/RagB family nutrient-binding outer membrane lipoprotein [Chitinophagaceae bacterium]